MSNMGPAPEILQARVRAEKESAAKARKVAGIPDAPLPPPPPPTAPSAPLTPANERSEFEKLPDDELREIAAQRLANFDGRWGRSRTIDELLKAGVSGLASVTAPPPPPTGT